MLVGRIFSAAREVSPFPLRCIVDINDGERIKSIGAQKDPDFFSAMQAGVSWGRAAALFVVVSGLTLLGKEPTQREISS